MLLQAAKGSAGLQTFDLENLVLVARLSEASPGSSRRCVHQCCTDMHPALASYLSGSSVELWPGWKLHSIVHSGAVPLDAEQAGLVGNVDDDTPRQGVVLPGGQ